MEGPQLERWEGRQNGTGRIHVWVGGYALQNYLNLAICSEIFKIKCWWGEEDKLFPTVWGSGWRSSRGRPPVPTVPVSHARRGGGGASSPGAPRPQPRPGPKGKNKEAVLEAPLESGFPAAAVTTGPQTVCGGPRVFRDLPVHSAPPAPHVA